jgi:hypothetical protein
MYVVIHRQGVSISRLIVTDYKLDDRWLISEMYCDVFFFEFPDVLRGPISLLGNW